MQSSSLRPFSPRTFVALIFFGAQIVLVIRAQFVTARDFCWAPYTTQVRYNLQVEVAGRQLTAWEAGRRYRQWQYGWESHSYQNLIDVITQYEETYGKEDRARVTLEYQVNGREARLWTRSPP